MRKTRKDARSDALEVESVLDAHEEVLDGAREDGEDGEDAAEARAVPRVVVARATPFRDAIVVEVVVALAAVDVSQDGGDGAQACEALVRVAPHVGVLVRMQLERTSAERTRNLAVRGRLGHVEEAIKRRAGSFGSLERLDEVKDLTVAVSDR